MSVCAAAGPPPPREAVAFLALEPFWRGAGDGVLFRIRSQYGMRASLLGTTGNLGHWHPSKLTRAVALTPSHRTPRVPPGTSRPR